ncbi:MAG: hypothetical protein CFE29_14105 [Bradyrhizobiaceae bacterium PARB1]|jgi:hypothetical protein|nr:MAG: hypothetical protein CFE29_14105 [Bradyrhizobiaceae bacterium PARB1]
MDLDSNRSPLMSKDSTTVLKFDLDYERMMRAMTTPDDIGAVMRVHSELDATFKHVVDTMLPSGRPHKHQYLSERINRLREAGLVEIRLAPAAVINAVRNKFAHHDKEQFQTRDVVKLAAAVEALYGGRKIPDHFEILDNRKGFERRWRFGDMNDKERFVFYGFMAIAGAAAIENDFEPETLKVTMPSWGTTIIARFAGLPFSSYMPLLLNKTSDDL